MERVHITYLMIFLLVLLGSLCAGTFIVNIREKRRLKRDRMARIDDQVRTASDREKAFRDKYGQ